MKQSKLNFTFKVVKNGKIIDRCQTHSKRRFYNKLRTINWQNKPLKVYLRISYGKRECNLGCLCSFYNDGEYETKQDLMKALEAFTE
ncbi:MAG: hypothetical protein Q7R97_00260 [Candidatus Daviesbacteria bacterium]|nr:hypothetical protein [Candidatus Daviesbacteria bacterium]